MRRIERLEFSGRTIDLTGASGNNAPVAPHVFVSTDEDVGTYSSGAASVLDSVFDVEGSALTVANPGTIHGGWGVLVLNADGTYTYTPNGFTQSLSQGDLSEDIFEYTVSDGSLTETARLIFHISGVNDAPEAAPDMSFASENEIVDADVLFNDFDPDGDAAGSFVIVDVSVPSGQGTVTIQGGFAHFDPGTDFDHLAAGESAEVVIDYTMADGYGLQSSSTHTLIVFGENDDPVANADLASTGEDESVTVDVLANDSDADNGAMLSVVFAASPSGQGSATVVDNQVLFDPGSDFEYLAAGESAEVVIDYFVEDEFGGFAASSLTVTVNGVGGNTAPVVENVILSTSEDVIATGNVLDYVFDAEGDDLTIANPGSFNSFLGRLALAADGSYSFTPSTFAQEIPEGEIYEHFFSYSVSDGTLTESAFLIVQVTGENDAPQANPDEDWAWENEVTWIDLGRNDWDVDMGGWAQFTEYSVRDGKGFFDGYYFDQGTDFDYLHFGEAATVVIDYTIEDDHGLRSSSTHTLTIYGYNDAPVANPDAISAGENEIVAIDVLANDTDVDLGTILNIHYAYAPVGQGSATVVDGQVVFDPGSDFDYLAAGESAEVVIEYGVGDEFNEPAFSTITVTVNGADEDVFGAASLAYAGGAGPELIDLPAVYLP